MSHWVIKILHTLAEIYHGSKDRKCEYWERPIFTTILLTTCFHHFLFLLVRLFILPPNQHAQSAEKQTNVAVRLLQQCETNHKKCLSLADGQASAGFVVAWRWFSGNLEENSQFLLFLMVVVTFLFTLRCIISYSISSISFVAYIVQYWKAENDLYINADYQY